MDDGSPARHALVLHQSSLRHRENTVAWVVDALSRGDKVLHRAADPNRLVDAIGEVAGTAEDSGQLEIVDAHRARTMTDGLPRALHQMFEDLVGRAFDDGYREIVLTADEEAERIMVPEAGDRVAHEHDLDRLAMQPGVHVLCSYDLRVEQPDVVEAVVGVHHRCVDDVLWSARLSGERLLVRGEIDLSNAVRFGSALSAAAAHGVRTVDLREVTVLSAAGTRAFEVTAGFLRERGERLTLANMSPKVRLAAATLLVAGEQVVDVVEPRAER
ncbi:MAG TPA: MEDS domain-containing protein [Actinophytocola sp.]|jgi:anti-anti-sigma regulatory factor|uniref:MEDS domain-containing protein n=1 Tax=Actinophytocola sp. TaxID=1872138 RepID=UPI002F92925D